MKFTEKYIKMCDTPEIQDNWKPEVGDYHFHRGDNLKNVEPVGREGYNNARLMNHSKCIFAFLPLQHQLQEMLKGKGFFRDDMFTEWYILNFYTFCVGSENPIYTTNYYCDEDRKALCYVMDINELTLAFVMYRLHQKKWNNTKGVWFNAQSQ